MTLSDIFKLIEEAQEFFPDDDSMKEGYLEALDDIKIILEKEENETLLISKRC